MVPQPATQRRSSSPTRRSPLPPRVRPPPEAVEAARRAKQRQKELPRVRGTTQMSPSNVKELPPLVMRTPTSHSETDPVASITTAPVAASAAATDPDAAATTATNPNTVAAPRTLVRAAKSRRTIRVSPASLSKRPIAPRSFIASRSDDRLPAFNASVAPTAVVWATDGCGDLLTRTAGCTTVSTRDLLGLHCKPSGEPTGSLRFLHIPKNGGSAVSAILSATAREATAAGEPNIYTHELVETWQVL